jgi:hypothetical protein
MPIEVTRMTEADIDGAIDTIQQAFADDPYNNWVYPDRSKVQQHQTHCTRTSMLTLPPGRPDTQPRLAHAAVSLGHIAWPLPRRARHLEPRQDPRLRNVDASSAALTTRTMVAVPFLLVAVAEPDPDEYLVRSRGAEYSAVLDMEGAPGGSAEGTLDERQRVLLLQHRNGPARSAGERRGEEVDGGSSAVGRRRGYLVLLGELEEGTQCADIREVWI